MSLRTMVAAWESNGDRRRRSKHHEEARANTIARGITVGSEMADYRRMPHAEYVAQTDEATITADAKSGAWRIARRVAAIGILAGILIDAYAQRDTFSPADGLAPVPGVLHHIGEAASVAMLDQDVPLVISMPAVTSELVS